MKWKDRELAQAHDVLDRYVPVVPTAWVARARGA